MITSKPLQRSVCRHLRAWPIIVVLHAVAARSASADLVAPEPSAAGPPTVVCTFERTACFGPCPIYQVAVFSDGRVDFAGTGHVKMIGEYSARVSPRTVDDVRKLLDEIRTASQDPPRANCGQRTDHPAVRISWRKEGRLLHLNHYHGNECASPKLAPLEDQFDRLVATAQWVGTREERLAIEERRRRELFAAIGARGNGLQSRPSSRPDVSARPSGKVPAGLLLRASCESGVAVRIRAAYANPANFGADGGTFLQLDTTGAVPLAAGQAGRILEGPSGNRMLPGGVFVINQVVDPSFSNAIVNLPSVGKNRRVIICTDSIVGR